MRRLEGHELFPWRDARGVYRFEEAEVERVRQQLQRGSVGAAKGGWLSRGRRVSGRQQWNCSSQSLLPVVELEKLQAENVQLRADLESLLDELSATLG